MKHTLLIHTLNMPQFFTQKQNSLASCRKKEKWDTDCADSTDKSTLNLCLSVKSVYKISKTDLYDSLLELGNAMKSDKHKVAPTILLVDDEKSIYEPLQAILEGWGGYKVLVANNGLQALTVYDQQAHHISLVVTDMMMLPMNGEALIQALYERDQNIKIIGLSGQLRSSSKKITTPVTIEWLSKPIDARVLVQTINRLLA